jgi:hypothetical protein
LGEINVGLKINKVKATFIDRAHDDGTTNNNSTQVSTEEFQNVDDFLEACKKKLQIPN